MNCVDCGDKIIRFYRVDFKKKNDRCDSCRDRYYSKMSYENRKKKLAMERNK